MLKQFKNFHLYLLPLNSIKYLDGIKETLENIWNPYVDNNDSIRGQYISISERAKLQDIAIKITRDIIITNVTTHINAIKEKFKRIGFGFFSKDPFSLESDLEWKVKLAGDFAFLFQQYNDATNFYGKLYDRLKKVIWLIMNSKKPIIQR